MTPFCAWQKPAASIKRLRNYNIYDTLAFLQQVIGIIRFGLSVLLDLQLFVRTHRGLVLTKAGQSLYQDTKYIIQYCKDSVT